MKEEIYIPINPKTSFRNAPRRLVGRLWSSIHYKSAAILDTNILVSRTEDKDDGRTIRPGKEAVLFIGESVDIEEKNKIESGGFTRNFKAKTDVLHFEDFRSQDPNLCPFYFNLISNMHNPAFFPDPLFAFELKINNLIRKRRKNGALEQASMDIASNIAQYAGKHRNSYGLQKTAYETYMDAAALKYMRKKVKDTKSPTTNSLNDCRLMALALTKCLHERVHVKLYTADSDFIMHFSRIVDGFAFNTAMKKTVLEHLGRLTDKERKEFRKKKKYIFYPPTDSFLKLFNGIHDDLLARDWKGISTWRFTIMYWDVQKHKYYKGFTLNFNEKMRNFLLTIRDNADCPYVKNTDNTNWFTTLYWPPLPNNAYFKVLVRPRKELRGKSVSNIPGPFHYFNCWNMHQDSRSRLLGENRVFHQFT